MQQVPITNCEVNSKHLSTLSHNASSLKTLLILERFWSTGNSTCTYDKLYCIAYLKLVSCEPLCQIVNGILTLSDQAVLPSTSSSSAALLTHSEHQEAIQSKAVTMTTTANCNGRARFSREPRLVSGRLVRGRLVRGRLVSGRLVRGRLVRGRLVRGRLVRGRLGI